MAPPKAAPAKGAKETNIQVVLRCRARNDAEKKAGSPSIVDCNPSTREVVVKQNSSLSSDKLTTKTFTFDRVFGPDTAQQDLYADVVEPMLDEVIQGYNCTIFAYGQTGTGKTYTMEGRRSVEEPGVVAHDDPEAGIIPRTLHHLFEMLEKMSESEYAVKVSFVELYNEELRDLLGTDEPTGAPAAPPTAAMGNAAAQGGRLRIFEDAARKGTVIIQGLEEVVVHNREEVYSIMARGSAKRATAATQMNIQSSRSHCVFTITVHLKETTVEGEELVKIGKFNLVDLAGSENIGRSGAMNQRAREAGNINQSLLTLGRVITALVDHSPHVPYRESKLTRLLQDSLGGHTKTCIIATISPAAVNIDETLSTLDYAHRAKSIKNRPEVNQRVSKRTLIREYTEEIERLKRDLIAAREKSGIFVSGETFAEMERQIRAAAEGAIETAAKIDAYEQEIAKVNGLFEATRKELAQASTELNATKVTLKGVEETLETTKADLERTEKAREERDIVAKARKETEDSLRGIAHSLIGTVNETVNDVDALHAKIERKSNVETANATTAGKLREDVRASAAALSHLVASFASTHAVATEDLKSQFESLSSASENGSRALSAAAVALSAAVAARIDSLGAVLTARQAEAEELAAKGKESRALATAEVVAALNALGQDISEALVDGIGASAERFHGEFAARANATRDAISAGEQLTRSYAEQQRAHVAALVEKTSALAAAACSGMNERQANFAALVAAQRKAYVDASVAAAAKVSEVFRALEEVHVSALDSASVAALGAMDVAKDDVSAVTNATSAFAATLGEAFDGYCEGAATRFAAAVSALDAQTECGAAHATAVESAAKSARASAVEKVGAVVSRCEAGRVAEDEMSAGAHGWWVAAVASHAALAAEGAADAAQKCAVIETAAVASAEGQRAMCGKGNELVVASETACASFLKEASGGVSSIASRIDSYVSAEYASDLPTGRTPKKRTYTFPKNIPSPRIDEELVARFREGMRAMMEADGDDADVSAGTTASAEDGIAPAPVEGKENDAMELESAAVKSLSQSLSRLPVKRKGSVKAKKEDGRPLETLDSNAVSAQ